MNKEYPSRLITEERILGMTLEECEHFLKIRGYFPRVICENYQSACDINPKRVNIEIKDNIVVKLINIG